MGKMQHHHKSLSPLPRKAGRQRMNGRGRRDRRGMPTGGGLLRTTRGRRGASDGRTSRGGEERTIRKKSPPYISFLWGSKGFLGRLSAAGRLVASGRAGGANLSCSGFLCLPCILMRERERGRRRGTIQTWRDKKRAEDGTAPGVVSQIADIKRGMMMSAGGGVSGWWAWAGYWPSLLT